MKKMDGVSINGGEKSLFGIHTGLKEVGMLVLCMLYIIAGILLPPSEIILHKLLVTLLMLLASYEDIRKKEFSVAICCVIFLINALHSIFYSHDYFIWIVAAVLVFFLLVIHFINQKIIGIGDITLLGLCISAILIEHILIFLFLSFFLSAIVGVVIGISKKNMKDLTVPMVPCITLAFVFVIFVLR